MTRSFSLIKFESPLTDSVTSITVASAFGYSPARSSASFWIAEAGIHQRDDQHRLWSHVSSPSILPYPVEIS